MKFDRRVILKGSVAIPLAAALPRWALASGAFNPEPGPWRTFQIVTRLEIAKPEGKTQAWVPVPAVNEADWFKSLGSQWNGNGSAELVRDPKYGSALVHVEWKDGEASPAIEVISKISTRDRAVDLSKPGSARPLPAADHKLYTEAPNSFLLMESSSKPRTRSLRAPRLTWIRSARSTSGSSPIRSETERCAGAASAISRRCSRPAISAGNAPISMHCMLGSCARPASLPATFTASALLRRNSDTRASAPDLK
jgi:hypothetical protein